MIVQGSPEWFQVRLGLVTASRVADVVARTKTGYGASRANYMAQLIAERLTGEVAASFANAAMRWGIETEPEARAAYEFFHDCEVRPAGFQRHPRISDSGASPDGCICDEGLVEFKCPSTATHIDSFLGQEVASKYVIQIQWQLACTGRKWADFVSFDKRLPEAMRLFVKRIPRDEGRIFELEQEVKTFLRELDAKLVALTKKLEVAA